MSTSTMYSIKKKKIFLKNFDTQKIELKNILHICKWNTKVLGKNYVHCDAMQAKRPVINLRNDMFVK